MIQLRNLNKGYLLNNQHIPVIQEINLVVTQGEFIALTGRSGSGKSTLMNILGLLDNYDKGEYLFFDKPIKGFSEKEAAVFRNNYVGFIFQSFNLLPFKTAVENVELPLQYKRNISSKEIRSRAENLLGKMGLADRKNHLPAELSGGQKQRVAIARALVSDPLLLLADEPTGALDSTTADDIIHLLTELNKEGKTIVMVTHDKEIAKRSHRVIELRDGKAL